MKLNTIYLGARTTVKCTNRTRTSVKLSFVKFPTVKYNIRKDFPKERYNTYAKSCNSNLYTKYPGATYSGLLLGTMRCL